MRQVLAILMGPAIALAACGSVRGEAPGNPTSAAAASANDILVVGGRAGTIVLDARGQLLADLGPVIGAPGWSAAFGVEADASGNTSVRVIDVRSGGTTRTIPVTGQYRAAGPYPGGNGGLSPNGRWLALADARSDRSAFAVVDTTGQKPPRRLDVAGHFVFDALSDDGESLYLVERMTGTQYRVRVVDVRSGLLLPGAVVDVKQLASTADANGVMNGTYTTAVAGPSGQWYFSVYQHPVKGPFIHALNTQTRIAECILDLPTFGTAGPLEMAKQPFWSLAIGQLHGVARLYAVNGALGQIALVDPYEIKVKKTAAIQVPAPSAAGASFAPLAGAVVSPDGYRLYAVGEEAIFVIDTSDLALRATFRVPARSLAVSADNARLYALTADGTSVVVLDARTGRTGNSLALHVTAEFIAVQKR